MTNPYLHARRAWDERYGDALAQARQWRLTALLSLLACVGLASALALDVTRDRVVPYVVAVDNLGQAANGGLATRSASKVPPAAVKVALEQWLENARTVYRDTIAQKAALDKVYAILGPVADKFINDYYTANNSANSPITKMRTSSVSVVINSYLPLSDNTVQISWTETTRALTGDVISTKRWQANITYIAEPPTTSKEANENPLGLQIKTIAWSELP